MKVNKELERARAIALNPPSGGALVNKELERARAIALRSLDAAPRSRAQLKDLLTRREIDPAVISELLDRFEASGLIDDAAYAEMLVRTRYSERGLVGPALAAELARKGIAPDLAERAMAQIDAEDEASAAEQIASKKLAQTAALPKEVRLRRAVAQLTRKGYSPGIALSTVKRLLAEEPST